MSSQTQRRPFALVWQLCTPASVAQGVVNTDGLRHEPNAKIISLLTKSRLTTCLYKHRNKTHVLCGAILTISYKDRSALAGRWENARIVVFGPSDWFSATS